MKKILAMLVCMLMLTMIFPVSGTINGIKKDVDIAFNIFGGNNSLPYVPSNPAPRGDFPVDIYVNLSWDGGDPDLGDTVTYFVFLDYTFPLDLVAIVGPYPANQTRIQYDPDGLEYFVTYYWMVVANDDHGHSVEGPTWRFITKISPVPDLDCSGNLNWIDVEPGSTVTGNFTVSNIGEVDSLLDWEIISWPEWGTWSFDPSNGSDLTPADGPVTVQVSVVAPKQVAVGIREGLGKEYTGEVKVVNKENSSDYCTISAYMKVPKDKAFNSNFNLLNWLFEMHPRMFPMLRLLFDLN